MIKNYQQYQPAVIIGVQQVPWSEVYRYGTVKFHPDQSLPGRISALMEKLPAGQAPSDIIQGGRFVVSPKLPLVLEKTAIARGELWFADAVNFLAQNDIALTLDYQKNNAFWATTGDPLNWLRVNLLLAKSHPDFKDLA
jgi:UTP--glucose-1-phosphate uridylyltransferase